MGQVSSYYLYYSSCKNQFLTWQPAILPSYLNFFYPKDSHVGKNCFNTNGNKSDTGDCFQKMQKENFLQITFNNMYMFLNPLKVHIYHVVPHLRNKAFELLQHSNITVGPLTFC